LFEERFAAKVGCRYALAMNSGTAALHSALFAVGVGPGDEVIVPAYTWHATVSAVLCCGARPVFCDIDPETLTADPNDIERRITPSTKAIMVVHVWGNPAAMDRITELARKHGLSVVEDCSHAHGATYGGKSVGTWGAIGCFSLQGGKAVSAGEGGVAVTNDRRYYERMLALGFPIRAGAEIADGQSRLGNVHLGPKYRPHLAAMILALSSLERLDALNRLRRRNWQWLSEALHTCPAVRPVSSYPSAERGGFLEFKLVVNPQYLSCDVVTFVNDLKAEGVPVSIDRYGALHRHPMLRRGGPITLDLYENPERGCPPVPELPHLESLQGRVLSLPPFTQVKEAFVRQCGAAIRKVAELRAARNG
jgi:dTDP-4-amino-4,6-dideoxygalactose transaminase